jgi:hypothetical protein
MVQAKKVSGRKEIKAAMHKDVESMRWSSFDHFWATNIKNGTDSTKMACVAHLKAIGSWDDQAKWVKGVLHFGIPLEK